LVVPVVVGVAVVTTTVDCVAVCGGPADDVVLEVVVGELGGVAELGGAGAELDDWDAVVDELETGALELELEELGAALELVGAGDPEIVEEAADEEDALAEELVLGWIMNEGYGGK
jgi:hypothetical protein